MKMFSRNLTMALAAGILALPGYAAAQTMGTTTGQSPTGFSVANGATNGTASMPSPTSSPFNQPAVPLGSDGKPLTPSISTVPPLPGQPTSSLRVGRIPNEGEKDANGMTVHYSMAGHEKGTGYGILNGVVLPPRTFNNVKDYSSQ